MKLLHGRRGGKGLEELTIDPAKRGGWRVEEEFVNAIRGREPVTHTDFVTGAKYMEWTDAVTASLRSGQAVRLPHAVRSLRLRAGAALPAKGGAIASPRLRPNPKRR